MQQIGRYIIQGELGRGAMGIVYRAQDPAIGRTVAIKSIRLNELADAQERQRLRERLFREAQSAGVLSNPHIVTIYDFQEEGDLAFIFMEYVDGASLEKLMSGPEALPPQQITSLLSQTAAAMDYAHRNGIVHRDIKPANIMLTKSGDVKITDFGIAKVSSSQQTQTGVLMGTPCYMSPEQVQGLPVDGRSDQFALAVIAYELLTGDLPFTGNPIATLLFKIVQADPAPPSLINPTLGPAVDLVFKKALAKDAAGRYETCTAFVVALEAALQNRKGWHALPRGSSTNLPTAALTTPPGRITTPEGLRQSTTRAAARDSVEQRHSSRGWAGALAFLITLLAVGGGYYIWRSNVRDTGVDTPAQVAAQPPPAQPAAPEKPNPMQTAEVRPPAGEPAKASKQTSEDMEPAPQAESPREPAKPASTPPAKGPAEQTVQISTNPPGATVTLDGKAELKCKTPCTLALAPGRHVLAGNLEGYRPVSKIFEVPQETDLNLEMERRSGTLMVRSAPSGATILLNGQEQAQKTPAVLKLAVGRYKLALVKEGLPREEQEVEIKDSVITNLEINWGR